MLGRSWPQERPIFRWIRAKPPALERKKRYIEHLQTADADTLLVSLADKLHNARTLLLDFRTRGSGVFKRFHLSRADTLWYYSELAQTYCARRPGGLADELARVVADLNREAQTRKQDVRDGKGDESPQKGAVGHR